MPKKDDKRRLHIFVRGAAQTEEYKFPGGGTTRRLPPRERRSHAQLLLDSLDHARAEDSERKKKFEAWVVPAKKGVHLEFESEPNFNLELKSLDSRRRNGLKLVNVRDSPDTENSTLATVWVPEGKLEELEKKIRSYAEEETRSGRPRYEDLVQKISQIRLAQLRSFWTDRIELLPETNEVIWWEVWLRDPQVVFLTAFRDVAAVLGIEVGEKSLEFPSTRVILARGTLEQFANSLELVDSIAELRRAKEVPSTFLEMSPREMGEWANELLERTRPPHSDAPILCLHDTGVNAGHPLLRLAFEDSDLHTVDPSWGSDDHNGHGTGMAGLAIYGDLAEQLAGSLQIDIDARLESVKILPPPPRKNNPALYGSISEQATYRVEIERPRQRRIHVMAITTTDDRDLGKPSSWSAAIDKLAYNDEGGDKRLWIIAGGNNNDLQARAAHPHHLGTEEIHDPGQAWNALTIGASTERWNPSERGYLYRHRYASHGFRFGVRGATESLESFRKRLNKAAREEGERSPASGDPSGWSLGTNGRHRGSLHSDIWRGPAVELANRRHIAVYPVSGWWKERHNLERWKKRARYSLVVSIHAPEVEVDLYTPVENAVRVVIET